MSTVVIVRLYHIYVLSIHNHKHVFKLLISVTSEFFLIVCLELQMQTPSPQKQTHTPKWTPQELSVFGVGPTH